MAIDCRSINLLSSADKPVPGRREEAERYEELANASAIYAALGRYGKAQDAADFAESLYSGDRTLAYVKAQTAMEMQRDDEAEAILKDALSSVKRMLDGMTLASFTCGCGVIPKLFLSWRTRPAFPTLTMSDMH